MVNIGVYKGMAGRIADTAINEGVGPAVVEVLYKRRKKPIHAALVGGLVVGALIERGQADVAEKLTIALAHLAED